MRGRNAEKFCRLKSYFKVIPAARRSAHFTTLELRLLFLREIRWCLIEKKKIDISRYYTTIPTSLTKNRAQISPNA